VRSVVDLNKEEVKILLSGLHNLILDDQLLDYWLSKNDNARNTIEVLINKFEETFKN